MLSDSELSNIPTLVCRDNLRVGQETLLPCRLVTATGELTHYRIVVAELCLPLDFKSGRQIILLVNDCVERSRTLEGSRVSAQDAASQCQHREPPQLAERRCQPDTLGGVDGDAHRLGTSNTAPGRRRSRDQARNLKLSYLTGKLAVHVRLHIRLSPPPSHLRSAWQTTSSRSST
ncbi:hypothetical protein C8Q80DRAFT_291947 [Daedaleopsis nitida]|nr:hypothetical protein C8Q80DRAFT_291947 [Daedaleopsis nitida]